jgi:hypothetical protein
MEPNSYVYLDIEHPVVAWATYRGALVSAGTAATEPGALSMFATNLFEFSGNPRLHNELVIDAARPRSRSTPSRLRGLFCFPDRDSALRAAETGWGGGHFRKDQLAEAHAEEIAGAPRFDSNWITYAPLDDRGLMVPTESAWIGQYWEGQPFPGHQPVWECIVEGRLWILGTDLRDHAYDVVKRSFPNSLGWLEVARIAAWVGSDLGNICGWFLQQGDRATFAYAMDLREVNDPDFLGRIKAHIDGDGEVNHADLRPHMERGSFGNLPDLQMYRFGRRLEEITQAIVSAALSAAAVSERVATDPNCTASRARST